MSDLVINLDSRFSHDEAAYTCMLRVWHNFSELGHLTCLIKKSTGKKEVQTKVMIKVLKQGCYGGRNSAKQDVFF